MSLGKAARRDSTQSSSTDQSVQMYINATPPVPAPTPVVDPQRIEILARAAARLVGILDPLHQAISTASWQSPARAGFELRFEAATKIVATSATSLRKLAQWGRADRDLATFERQLLARSNQGSWIVAQLFASDPRASGDSLSIDTSALRNALPQFGNVSDAIRSVFQLLGHDAFVVDGDLTAVRNWLSRESSAVQYAIDRITNIVPITNSIASTSTMLPFDSYESRLACAPQRNESSRATSGLSAAFSPTAFAYNTDQLRGAPTFDSAFRSSATLRAEFDRLALKWQFVNEHDSGETPSVLAVNRQTWIVGDNMRTEFDINDPVFRRFLNNVHIWIVDGGFARGESSPIVPEKFQGYSERIDGFVGDLYGLNVAETERSRTLWTQVFAESQTSLAPGARISFSVDPRARDKDDVWWTLPMGGLAWSKSLTDTQITQLVQAEPDHPFFQTSVGHDRLVLAERADFANDYLKWQADAHAVFERVRPGGHIDGESVSDFYIRAQSPFDSRTYADLLDSPPIALRDLTTGEAWALRNSLREHLEYELGRGGDRIFSDTYVAPVHQQNRWLRSETTDGHFDPVVAHALANPLVRSYAHLPLDIGAPIDETALAIDLALAITGLIPGLDTASDIASLAIDLSRGDLTAAFFDAAFAAIPFISYKTYKAITRSARVAARIWRTTANIEEELRDLRKLGNINHDLNRSLREAEFAARREVDTQRAVDVLDESNTPSAHEPSPTPTQPDYTNFAPPTTLAYNPSSSAAQRAAEHRASMGRETKMNIDHIFDGNTKNRKSGVIASGHHVANNSTDSRTKIVEVLEVDAATGVYEARVAVWNEGLNQFVDKPNVSTFYPDSWTAEEIVDAIDGAFDVKTVTIDGRWSGEHAGIKLQGFYDARTDTITSAHPVLR